MARFLILLALALAPGLAAAEGCNPPAPLRFAPGASGTVVDGAVPRGAPDCFTLRARAGQTMEVRVDSPERNAALSVWAPGWRLAVDGTAVDITPDPLDTGNGKRFRLVLPRSGEYLLVMGTERGGAPYRMTLSIR
ncbi:hypothetical protein [Sabulicella rubraurantiaca]|uniref:hypothetical protein n=1 Tax=Sabulicella rubraurantiaca TaxID=2811429 RepID=UPI001A970AEA|nr:hypothetical protein [Sabulicella rubraurantiaca]